MTYHVLPINDIKEHEELSTCHCKPNIVFENGHMIIIYNSFDGREIGEELINLINKSNANKKS